jgi:hypothetical protein
MRKLEIIQIHSEELNKSVNALSIDGDLFDWGMDPEEFQHTKKLMKHHRELKESVILSLANHFTECFSEFIGREITLEELNEAIKKGEIL